MIELRTLSLLEELRCHVALAQQYGILQNTIAFYYVYLYQFLSQHGIDVMGIRYYNNSGINIYKVNALSFTFFSYLDHVSDSRMRFHQSPQQLHGYILKMHGFVGHTIKKASAGGMRCPYVPVCILCSCSFFHMHGW